MASNDGEDADCSSSLSSEEALSENEIEMEQYGCEICKMPVRKKLNFPDRRFGLLENCMHVFCLSCIREHRANADILYFFKKNDECEQCVPAPVFCSVCEVPSMCIASSTVWIEDEVEKALYFEAYKRSVSKISCPWMRFGQGKCLSLKCGIKANDWKRRRKIVKKNRKLAAKKADI